MIESRSVISPLRIDAVDVPGTGGVIGITECPGKNVYPGLGLTVGPWKRDLDLDLMVILEWQPDVLVSLLEDYEFELLGVPELLDRINKLGIRWLRLPIPHGGVPDDLFEEEWEIIGKELHGILAQGGRVLLQCGGGLGRSGLVAARLLVEFGMDPCPAFAAVRQARPNAILNEDQEDYVRRSRRKLRTYP